MIRFAALLLLSTAAVAQVPADAPDIVKDFRLANAPRDFERREVEIRMRDGVTLHTVIVLPKGAKDAPMILTRTPYNADARTARSESPSMLSTLPQGDEEFVADGYIRVFQDVRGKYGSKGDYVLNRPVRGPLNRTKTDHVTDAWDTVEWLSKNVKESNGRVGMIGSSYEGFTVLMALIDPHPALKVAVPMSPMVDGWIGDDWLQNGAFRQNSWSFLASQTTKRGAGEDLAMGFYDDYDGYLKMGSAGDVARRFGIDRLPAAQKIMQHPAYDAFWQGQAVDKLLAKVPLKVPTMNVVGAFDQEDIYGAYAVYDALEPKDTGNDRNFLVVGPWRHSGVNYEGRMLGALKFEGDTALQFRRDVMKPFLDQYLKPGARKADTPPVFSYQLGMDRWQRLDRWPGTEQRVPLYLTGASGLSFTKPTTAGGDSYVSDPAKPVPFVPRPVRMEERPVWTTWLVGDQRFADGRTDVLTYVTEPLTEPLHVQGKPLASLFASTTGTDADWVVKLIDVHPDEVASNPAMGGYQLPVSLTIFRGRYREGFETAKPVAARATLGYRFTLPDTNHVFRKGHRVMVQIQSTLFPLYDRNPQTFVPNIFDARPGDYAAQTHRISWGGGEASAMELPVVWDPLQR